MLVWFMGGAGTENDPIRRRMESLSVEELLQVVGVGADDWQPEAQAIAREELQRRGVAIIPTPALKAQEEVARRAASAENARGDMVLGGLCCLGGTAVTVVSYLAISERGGTYLIAWGAILFGFLKFVRGFFAWIDRH